MKKDKILLRGDRGYILLMVVVMMLVMAVMAFGMNRRAGMQAKMAANQTRSSQTHLGQIAALEDAAWTLNRNPAWRTSDAGEDYTFNGIKYKRFVLDASGYSDVVTVTVLAPGGLKKVSTSFRLIQETVISYLIADTENHRIRRVDIATGLITTFAGNGSSGYSGDDGPATDASMQKPGGVWAGEFGIVYIADTENHCIRKVDAAGTITTVVGIGGSHDFSGDGGQATSAQLDNPEGVWVDSSENIYIADTENHVIRKVDASTGFITTIAGTGSSGDAGDDGPAISANINKPKGVWVDESGNILIADTENNRVKKVDTSTGIITTVAGNGSLGYSGDNGPATSASLKNPHAVCIHEAPAPAYLVIADPSNHRIREVNLTTGIITTVAGTLWSGYNGDNIDATSARLYYPFGVHVDASHNTYIADTYNHRIRKVDGKTGIITTAAGIGSKGFSGDGGPATSARLRYPHNLYLDSAGNIYIVDTFNYRIRKVDAATQTITTVVGDGAAKFQGDGGLATDASIMKSYDVAVDSAGNIFIADTHSHAIRKVDSTTGIINTVVGQGGSAGFEGDGGLATDAKLNSPTGVYVDAVGNIYVVDTKNEVIRKVDATTNIINTVAGNGTAGFSGDGGLATLAQLDYPEAVWVDSSGNMFIVDTDNCRIRRVDGTTGIITTVAGTTYCGYNGNDQPATDAALYYPSEASVYEPSSLERLPAIYRASN